MLREFQILSFHKTIVNLTRLQLFPQHVFRLLWHSTRKWNRVVFYFLSARSFLSSQLENLTFSSVYRRGTTAPYSHVLCIFSRLYYGFKIKILRQDVYCVNITVVWCHFNFVSMCCGARSRKKLLISHYYKKLVLNLSVSTNI